MPSLKILEKKKAQVEELTNSLKESCAGVLVDYKGISVDEDVKLRKELREASVKYSVIKNTILLRAFNNVGFESLNDKLQGTTALAICKEDHVAAARILSKFAQDSDFFKIKAGFLDDRVIDDSGVIALAKLPSKEVLIAMMLGSLKAPMSGLVGVLSGILRSFALVVNAIKNQAEQK